VARLEALGATVLPLTANVADLQSLSNAFGSIHSRLGRIAGVVHAAGVAGGRMLMLPETEDSGRALAPKLHGTINLLNLVAPHQPDFVVLCSSFASVGGGPGQGEYVAANAFLDATAAYASSLALRTTAISWPAWRRVGMAYRMALPPELAHLREASLHTGIEPEEGVELLARVLSVRAPHVVVAPYTDRAKRPVSTPEGAASQIAVVAVPHVVSRKVDEGAAPAPVPALESDLPLLLRQRVETMWKDVLGVREIDLEDNFFEIGGQSLMALRIVMRVGEQFGAKLGLADVLDHPRFGDFCDHVYELLTAEIEMMPDRLVQRELESAAE
jgi:acyl carrier protein